jgi:hypothetical protein
MKMQKFACALFSFAFLFSCSDDSLLEAEPTLNIQKISNRIGVEEAIDYVEEARVFLDEQSPLESRYSRAVNSVSVLLFSDAKASAMKSGKYKDLGVSDTLAYVLNFGDSSGYAIVSKDKRVETPLFAFAEKGTLINGKTDNPGLAIFLERLEGYVLESIAKSGNGDEKKEVMAVAQKGPISPNSIYNFRSIVAPLVLVEWGQDRPYNNNLQYGDLVKPGYCPNTSNGRVLTGCTATAMAQIMSYWKQPTDIGGKTLNWTLLNNFKDTSYFYSSSSDPFWTMTARVMVAHLFERLGYHVNMNYKNGCEISVAYTPWALDTLKRFGFSYMPTKDYTTAYFEHTMEKLKPTFVTGCDPNIEMCHAWVIDGLAVRAGPLGIIVLSLADYFVHNNWGWDGKDNGYYLSRVFETNVFSPKEFLKITSIYR